MRVSLRVPVRAAGVRVSRGPGAQASVMSKPQYRTPEYRAERKRIDQAQAQGQWLECHQPECVMLTRDIAPDQPAHVGHDDSGTVIIGEVHALCNVTDGGRRRHLAPTPRRWDL